MMEQEQTDQVELEESAPVALEEQSQNHLENLVNVEETVESLGY